LYGDIFEQEYNSLINEYIQDASENYVNYLKSIKTSLTHKGYFSIDKKGRKVNSETKKGTDISDDESTYDLILKDKERLLSFDEPTRFIFSHSALREGWDNPNVFQICTLRHTNSIIQKHQEVGRGSRLCVNDLGDRIDSTIPNINVHDINKLTVIANDSYESFVKGLQSEISGTLFDRPKKASPDYFIGKKVYAQNGDILTLINKHGNLIYRYLLTNNYLDDNDVPNDEYLKDVENNSLKPINNELTSFEGHIHKLIQAVYNPKILSTIFENGNTSRIIDNKLNNNFYKEEFQKLWKLINHKYSYYVDFDSNELILKSITSINNNLSVSRLMYTVSVSEQKSQLTGEDIKTGSSFKDPKTSTSTIVGNTNSNIEYDLVGKISQLTTLRRKTVGSILLGINDSKFSLYKENPEEFISKISKLINDEKATMIVDHVTYNKIDGEFDSIIFAESKNSTDFHKAFKTSKHIKDYVFTDGIADKSIERVFAEDLEKAEEVCVYAKLPRSFYIPTPVGNYSPDWAIAFNEGTVKHIYFIAETKGSMDSMQLRKIESVKIECAKSLFNKMSSSKVRYDKVNSYSELIKIINSIR
jgi:type III restriction enzyme